VVEGHASILPRVGALLERYFDLRRSLTAPHDELEYGGLIEHVYN
jgi:hypothetical protein